MRTIGFLLVVVSVSAWAHTGLEPCPQLLVSVQQRQMAAATELLKLKPAGHTKIIHLNPASELKAISQSNLERLSAELNTRLPIENPSMQKQVAALVKDLDFVSLQIMRQYGEPELEPDPGEFFHQLLGGSRTVGFRWVATRKGSSLRNLNGQVPSRSARLTTPNENAFILPQFLGLMPLVQFFTEVDPERVMELVNANRWNLPQSAWSVQGFLTYLNPSTTAQIFPRETMLNRLSPLRHKLYQYLLTVDDARVFSEQLLEHYLSSSIASGNKTWSQVELAWNQPGGPAELMAEAYRSIGWQQGVSLREPLNAPASAYQIVQPEETIVLAQARGAPQQPRPMADGPLQWRRMGYMGTITEREPPP